MTADDWFEQGVNERERDMVEKLFAAGLPIELILRNGRPDVDIPLFPFPVGIEKKSNGERLSFWQRACRKVYESRGGFYFVSYDFDELPESLLRLICKK